MRLPERLDIIARGLPHDWTQADLLLTLDEAAEADEAAGYLAPLAPGRSGNSFRIRVLCPGRGGSTVSALAGALDCLDERGIRGRLTLTGLPAPEEVVGPTTDDDSLAARWTALEGEFPPTWSDALLELTLGSSDDSDRCALLLGPVNPLLRDEAHAFRFRVASGFGYGASTHMVRRCLERLDAESIAGTIRPIRVMSDSRPVSTQGPVWRVEGRLA
ncbi:MAG: hypothetical protein ACE5EV_04550 [Gaiellales bacterium]